MEPVILLRALTEAVKRSIADRGRAAIAYSGGLDSSLVAKLASESAEITCYSCVTAGSHDSERAADFGKKDGFKVRILALTEQDMPSAVARTARGIRSTDPTKIAYSIPTVVVLERCDEELVLAGNGADELFAGYEKYARRPSERESSMRDDLERSRNEAALLRSLARSLGKRVAFPYLEDEVLALAREIPLEQKISSVSRKAILREVGRLAGLSDADRPKKAAQYSSGTLKLMKALAKKDSKTLSEWIRLVISEHPLGKD
jgi:asparagine synthase (glutamine-hydrolysing)